jgi:predicted aspartyl protease
MTSTRTLAGAFAAACLAFDMGTAAHSACQLRMMAEFPIVMHGNHPLVEVSINGQPVKFLLETGSDTTIITREAAARLGLHTTFLNGVTFYGVGGSDGAQITTIRDLKIGAGAVHDVRMVVTGRGLRSSEYAGLLGADFFLQGDDIEFDFAGGVVRLFKPKDCKGDDVAYWAKSYSLASLLPGQAQEPVHLYVDLNGRKVEAVLATGFSHTTVTPNLARSAGVSPHVTNVSAAGKVDGLGDKPVETYVAEFPTLSIGDETVRNVTIQLGDLFAAATDTPPGSRLSETVMDDTMLLGADFFKAHRIYVARSQGKMYFSYNGGPIFEVGPKAEDKPAREPKPDASAKP